MAEDVKKSTSEPRLRRRASRVPVPFVTTETSTDLALAFALLPFWWALGLNQLVWAPLALLIYLKRTMVEKKLDHVRLATLIVVGAFVASYLATTAAWWVEDPGFFGHSLTFYYVELMYAAAAVFLVLAADCAASSERERLRVVAGIGAMGLGACAVGALPYLGLHPSYDAPVRFLLPEGLSSNEAGGAQIYGWSVERSLGNTACFFGYEVFRPRSLFTYATLYAAALAMVAPLQLYLAHRARRAALRLLWGAGALLSVVGLLLTTSRTVAAGLIVAGLVAALGWAAWAFFARRANRARLLLGLLGALCTGVALLAAGPWAAGALASVAGLEECGRGREAVAARESLLVEDRDAASLLRAGVVDARGGSLRDRLEVYRATLQRWPERPWLGFGTTRIDPEVRYPLGSHSMYLGTLFQRGAVGLAALLALLGYASYRLVRGLLRPGEHRPFLAFVAVSLLAGSMAGLANIFDLDASVQVLFWTLMGLAIGASYAAVAAGGEKEKEPSSQEEEKKGEEASGTL